MSIVRARRTKRMSRWEPKPKVRPKLKGRNRAARRPKRSRFVRPDYHEYIQSKAWIKKRWAVIVRRGFKCESCGSDKELHVHHLTYERLGKEKFSDLQVLCRVCHEGVHMDDPRVLDHADILHLRNPSCDRVMPTTTGAVLVPRDAVPG